MLLQATTSQTVGPFFRIGLNWLCCHDLASAGVSGERIEIAGRMLDGDNQPVPDGIIEIWQANSHGKYAHPDDTQDKPLEPHFRGYGRIATETDGSFNFTTIKPGRVPAPDVSKNKLQAPHILVSIFCRGLLRRLVSRIYFPDEPGNSEDFVLNLVEPERRETLIAKKAPDQDAALKWNIILQGPNETVFFDC